MVRHLPGVGVVAAAPEAGAVAGVAAVVDVDRGDADAVARDRLEVAHHVADARIAGDVDALPVRDRPASPPTAPARLKPRVETLPQPRIAARDLRLVDRADLVARVAGVGGDERVLGVEHLHQIADHAIGVDRRLVDSIHGRNFSRNACSAVRISSSSPRSCGRRPRVWTAPRQGLQRQLGVADQGVARLVAAVDVQRCRPCTGRSSSSRVGDGVAEAVGEEARADREQQVALAQEVLGQRAAHAERERMVLRERALALQRRQHRHLGQLGELRELGGGVGVEHALAHVEQRVAGRPAAPRPPP